MNVNTINGNTPVSQPQMMAATPVSTAAPASQPNTMTSQNGLTLESLFLQMGMPKEAVDQVLMQLPPPLVQRWRDLIRQHGEAGAKQVIKELMAMAQELEKQQATMQQGQPNKSFGSAVGMSNFAEDQSSGSGWWSHITGVLRELPLALQVLLGGGTLVGGTVLARKGIKRLSKPAGKKTLTEADVKKKFKFSFPWLGTIFASLVGGGVAAAVID